MEQDIEVSVVIPAYREEENLRLLLPRLASLLREAPFTSELLVVDTVEAHDSTPQVVAEAGARHVRRGPADTYGDAVRTGIAQARGRYIAFMDADGSHAPEVLGKLLAEREAWDVVAGSRYVEGGHTENPWILRAMSRVVNLVYTVVLGLPLKDVSNSLKVYRAALVKPLHLRCQNFDVIEELLVKLVRRNRGLRVVEVPVDFRKRMFGETKRNLVSFMLSYLVTLIRLRFTPLD